MRIPSTLCEQEKWDWIISGLDMGFLIDVVSGNSVTVYDATTRDGDSLAISRGLPAIRGYLEELHRNGHRQGPSNVEYARQFWGEGPIQLIGECRKTRHENQPTWWREILAGEVTAEMIRGER